MKTTTRHTSEEFVFAANTRVSLLSSLRELIVYRETVWSFAARTFRVRYKQALLGVAWAVLQPLAFLVVFLIFFNGVGDVEGGEGATYAAAALASLIAWQFVSSGVGFAGEAILQDGTLVRKVYFPREAPVIGAIGSYLPDFCIGIVLFLIAAPFTGAQVTWTAIVYVPMLLVLIIVPAVAISVPLAALAIHYRDFKYALPFAVQVWMFASPVAYPVTTIDESKQWIYALVNPIVGMLEGFRRVLALGQAPDWQLLGLSTATSVVLLFIGYHVFKRLEGEFADVL